MKSWQKKVATIATLIAGLSGMVEDRLGLGGSGLFIAVRLTMARRDAYNTLFGYHGESFQRAIQQDMANHFSAVKRARQTEKRSARNRGHISRLRNSLRSFRETLAAGDRKTAEARFRETVSAIDKAIRKGAIHGNTAARYKSRLSARLNRLAAK